MLKKLKLKNINRLIIGHLNINSLRNKFEDLKMLCKDNIDILVLTETKLDESFPTAQFIIDGFVKPFRLDRDGLGGGIFIYIKDHIPCKEIERQYCLQNNLEGIVLELNLRRKKILLFGGYNYNKTNIDTFLGHLGKILDRNMSKIDEFLLIGDFNSETHEAKLANFCDIYNLNSLIKEPTCYKNLSNPTTIDLILTNRKKCFQNSTTFETGLSDHHKMIVTVMKQYFPKQTPELIRYRDYRNFNIAVFRNDIKLALSILDENVTYDEFEKIFMEKLNEYAPMKKKYVRANNAPFMNKTLCKAIMNRSRLRNRYLKNPNCHQTELNYKRQKNYVVNLMRREKKKYYDNIDTSDITGNRKFWKNIKPLFSDKSKSSENIILLEGEEIISENDKVAETLNDFFTNIVENLNIKGYQTTQSNVKNIDRIILIIEKFKDHPSIVKINENIMVTDTFSLMDINNEYMTKLIENMNTVKPTTYNNIPAKILVENVDLCSSYISRMFNTSIKDSIFPDKLKMAEITPGFKDGDKTCKSNYRPISILPSVSKIFERIIYNSIYEYIGKYLSPYLCGFRSGYSTQYCLLYMIEKWKRILDNKGIACALTTDLSKAFDCVNHDLLIAKIAAYGFDYKSLSYILSYLTGRKQRTKVKNAFSTWTDILSGVPQGSILGPLLFNIYLNDIFFFVSADNLANYADDNTPYAIGRNIDNVLDTLTNDVNSLMDWFEANYFLLNPNKCKLLVSNHTDDITIKVGDEIIASNSWVKLLGVKIDSNLNFTEHVSTICKKASQKLHALARVSMYMKKNKLRVLCKSFIESQFGYCTMIWMFHNRTLNNKINRLHERALRLVYKNENSTFEDLLDMDNSFTIHDRNLQKLAKEMYKVKNNLCPSFIQSLFVISTNPYNLRNNQTFYAKNIHTVLNGSETISYRGPKTWDMVPCKIQNSQCLQEFNRKIKNWKPQGCSCRLCKIYICRIGFI